MNYDDLVCNNFYDIWGEFPEAAESGQKIPTLAALKRLGSSANDNREVQRLPRTHLQVLIVHHEEDAGWQALDEAAVEAVGNASAKGPSAGLQVSCPLTLSHGLCLASHERSWVKSASAFSICHLQYCVQGYA